MAFTHGKNTRLWIDQYELTDMFGEFTSAARAGVAETTVFGRGAKTFIGGLKEGQISANGFFDSDSDASDPVLSAALGRATNMVVTVSPTGSISIGARAIVSEAAETDYTISDPVNGVVSVSFSAQANNGLSTGVILLPWADTPQVGIGTTNLTGVNDRGMALGETTRGGLVGTLHIPTFSGTGSPTVTAKLQHSDDNSTWADLAFFMPAPVNAVGAFSTFVAYGVVINRFLRAVVTTAGSTISYTAIMAAARQ